MSNQIIEITDDNYMQEIQNYEGFILVLFYAEWDGDCKIMMSLFKKIATRLEGPVKMGTVEVDNNQKASQWYNIKEIPTFILFQDGKYLKRKTGTMTSSQLDFFATSYF